jgi:hypothetical protein
MLRLLGTPLWGLIPLGAGKVRGSQSPEPFDMLAEG